MASVTIQKHTTVSACSGQVAHIYREHKNYSNKHIDPKLLGDNLEMGDSEACRKLIKDTIAAIDAKKPPTRIKVDRKTVAEFSVPAPREGMSREDCVRFFSAAARELIAAGYHVCGGAIHADEVHEYIDPGDRARHLSRYHMHLLVVPETADRGCNMKSWLTKQRYRDVNAIMDRVCLRELGYTYQDGTRVQSRGSVEVLKEHSEALQVAENVRREAQKAREEAQKAREAAEAARAMESASMERIAAETAKMERNRADLEALRDRYAKAAIEEKQEIIELWEELESITGPQKLQLARDAKAYREIEQGLMLVSEDVATHIRETLADLRELGRTYDGPTHGDGPTHDDDLDR